ncbi:glycolate oxidase subunit GlcE [Hyphomicrobium sulfonivorans]|uniref:Glycolate dehydrogenase, FAD-binding subunit GlcE n=1 Tax=Hyphomicrobium sulfonivorans TaxID=121290 RepID=A0A109BIM6_HYPSL|nr:glycolate oxidase subunit GlcE [Hyphomicrobium sulfonivorans]KWT69339.1 Glycolate dehydrogenase, FAD-binding subunit GlcE [Hyphomicrobium sulfonivorans]MBI1651106.1 glycolate oxidase subunit GlcE [Hyphomicrobium sulfonivorans]NSL72510.1 glycolate oxidase subunit GlcE [Hyphomicrobium sulfonivorans]
MSDLQRPGADWELQFVIAGCAEKRMPVEIVGSGSKRGIGRPVDGAVTITTASLRGISLYEPNELVMSARAGTPLSQVESELATRGQMLPFEPIDLGPATGAAHGAQTIGGVFATNMSGARRIQCGAARDHLIGVKGVNGRAELFQLGGRVMKNVTGYDVTRGLAGSWGTLAVMTEVTFKVIPWPETAATVIYLGLPDDLAIELLSTALALPVEVSGAIHLQAPVAARLGHPGLRTMGKSVTALRLENFSSAVAGRKQHLKEMLKVYGKALELDHRESLEFWGELRRLSVMPNRPSLLWRISTKPTTAPKLVAAIKRYMPVEVYYDWGGALIWLEVPAADDASTAEIRRVTAIHGGHATLIRAEPAVRAAVEVFQPLDPGLERLTRGLKAAFDPAGILNPGRMYANL